MESTGRLSVRVYTSNAQLPLEGVTVVVTGQGTGGKHRLLSVQTTDSSGKIKPVTIQAPELWESTQPRREGAPAPYAVCSVWAEAPGYAMLQVDGVQIFPGVETVQNMMMLPLVRGESSLDHHSVREIPTQSL